MSEENTQQAATQPEKVETSIPYERFKEVNEKKKAAEEKLAAFEAAQKAQTEKKLKEDGELQKLIETKDAELKKIQSDFEMHKVKINEIKIEHAIEILAAQSGAADVKDIARLIDRDKISIDDTGAVKNAKEAIEALKESKPYLFAAAKAPGVHTDKSGKKDITTMSKEDLMKDSKAMNKLYTEHPDTFKRLFPHSA